MINGKVQESGREPQHVEVVIDDLLPDASGPGCTISLQNQEGIFLTAEYMPAMSSSLSSPQEDSSQPDGAAEETEDGVDGDMSRSESHYSSPGGAPGGGSPSGALLECQAKLEEALEALRQEKGKTESLEEDLSVTLGEVSTLKEEIVCINNGEKLEAEKDTTFNGCQLRPSDIKRLSDKVGYQLAL